MKEELELAAGQVTVPEENVLSGIMQVLEYYDLKPTQIRVYLCLAKSGPESAIQVAKKLGAERTVVYGALFGLEALGLVARSMSWPSRYTALSFREAVKLLWMERKRGLDAAQRVSEALAEALERMPRTTPEKDPQRFTFTRHGPNGLFLRKIEELSASNDRRLYYLEEAARRHVDQSIDGDHAATNVAHPELGSFIVFDRAVFLLRRNSREEWSATEIHAPEIVAAYAELYRLLEAEA